jgi:hypothetical protein
MINTVNNVISVEGLVTSLMDKPQGWDGEKFVLLFARGSG